MSYDHLIDKTIDVFLEQWDARFTGKQGSEGVIDLLEWLLYFAFDVTGELTYGSRHGFLESGLDSHGIIAYVQKFAVYGSIVRSSTALPYRERSPDILLPDGFVAFWGQAPST